MEVGFKNSLSGQIWILNNVENIHVINKLMANLSFLGVVKRCLKNKCLHLTWQSNTVWLYHLCLLVQCNFCQHLSTIGKFCGNRFNFRLYCFYTIHTQLLFEASLFSSSSPLIGMRRNEYAKWFNVYLFTPSLH